MNSQVILAVLFNCSSSSCRKTEMPSMHYMIEAAIKPFMIPFDRSAKVVQRRLLSHCELCESCKRIPKLIAKLSRRTRTCKDIHHATPSDMESAANEGCRLCDLLWKIHLQRATATQPPELNTRGHREFCEKRVHQIRENKLYLVAFTMSYPEYDTVSHWYNVWPVTGKLYMTIDLKQKNIDSPKCNQFSL